MSSVQSMRKNGRGGLPGRGPFGVRGGRPGRVGCLFGIGGRPGAIGGVLPLQAAEELQGIHSVGIIRESGMLGLAKWDEGCQGAGWGIRGRVLQWRNRRRIRGRLWCRCCSNKVLSLTYDALDILVTDEEGKRIFAGALIFVVQDADGAKGGAGLHEEDGLVGHIILFIQ